MVDEAHVEPHDQSLTRGRRRPLLRLERLTIDPVYPSPRRPCVEPRGPRGIEHLAEGLENADVLRRDSCTSCRESDEKKCSRDSETSHARFLLVWGWGRGTTRWIDSISYANADFAD